MDPIEQTPAAGIDPLAAHVEDTPFVTPPAPEPHRSAGSPADQTKPRSRSIAIAAADVATALRNLVGSTTTLNRERIELALKNVEQTPTQIYTVDIPATTSADRLQTAVVHSVLERFDADRAAQRRRFIGSKEMANIVAAFGTAHADTQALELAERLRVGLDNARFVISQNEPLTAADITTLRNQLALVKENDAVTVSLVPAPTREGGMSDDEKLALQSTLNRSLAENRSWAQLHHALAQENLVYQVRTNEKGGESYRGASMYRLAENGKKTFALRPSDIGYGLPTLEKQMGPFVSKEILTTQRTARETAQATTTITPATDATGRQPPPDIAAATTTTSPSADRSPTLATAPPAGADVERPTGSIGAPPVERAQGTLGESTGAATSNKSDLQREWDERLAVVTAYERTETQKYAGATAPERDAALSSVTLDVLMRRARINTYYHPRVALTGDLSHAADPLYRSAGTRFDYDRFQRHVAAVEAVPTDNGEFGKAVFIGRTHALPAFYDLGNVYKFTALTGTQPDAMKLAMMAAARRWGSVTINGNTAFQKAALQAAAELNIPISNAELQADYTRLRKTADDRDRKRTEAFERELAAAPADQKLTLTAFGTTATVVTPQTLQAAPERTTREYLVRGRFTVDERPVVVLEAAATGKLDVLEATPELIANEHIVTAEQNGIHAAAGISLTAGGGKPLDVTRSDAINNQLPRTTEGRNKGIPDLLAAETQVKQQNEMWREAGETFVNALAHRHWLGRTVLATVAAAQNTPLPMGKRSRPYDVSREPQSETAKRGERKAHADDRSNRGR